MASVIISGDTSGTVTLSAPAVAGSTTQTLVAATGTLAPLVSGTAVASTSGTSIDFTGIPSWVKRVTVMFSGVSTSGTSNMLVRLGDSGGIEATGYLSNLTGVTSGASGTGASDTTGFLCGVGASAANNFAGYMSIVNITGNAWVEGISTAATNSTFSASGGGSKTLSDILTQVRITTVNGTDTFDAGSINIMYE